MEKEEQSTIKLHRQGYSAVPPKSDGALNT